MLHEGIALVGIAMVLRSRKLQAENPSEEQQPADDTPAPPIGGGRLPDPTLDEAVLGNPLLIGAPYPMGFNITLGQIPPWQGGNLGAGSIPPSVQGGQWTPQLYGAASASYGKIIGKLPSAVRWKVNNIKRVVNFHRRLFKKIFG